MGTFNHLPLSLVVEADEAVIRQGETTIRVSKDQALQVGRFLILAFKEKSIPDPKLDSGFDQFWFEYPRKEVKAVAFKAWRVGECYRHLPKILAHISMMKTSDQWKKGFIPMPTTYLHQKRWEDLVETNDMWEDAT